MSNTIRIATTKVDQGGNKSNNVCSLPSRISKISDKISQKINQQKSSKDFDVQNPKRSLATEPPRTATNSQQPAGFSFKSAQIWENFYKIGATTRSIGPRSTKPENFRPKNPSTRHHVPPKDPAVAAFDNTRSYSWSRAYTLALIHVPSVHDVMDDVILHYLGLTRIDLETWPSPNRLPKKKFK